MLLLALLLVLVGAIVAVAVERTVGLIIAVVGVILLVVALVDVNDAEAAVQAAAASWR